MMVAFPEVDMDSISSVNQKQTYWLLYQMMKEDFVHKEDLKIMFNTAIVVGAVTTTGGPGTITPVPGMVVVTPSEVVATAKGIAYQALATAGGAVREGLISGLEATTSGK